MIDKNFAICGGGVIGLLLAKVLADLDYKVDVYLGDNKKHEDIMVHAASATTVNLLKSIGVWDFIAANEVKKMLVCDEQHSFVWQFLAQDIDQLQLGYIFKVSDLYQNLMQVCKESENISIYFSSLVRLKNSDDSIEVEDDLANKKTYSWLFAADGKNSWVKSQLKQPAKMVDHHQLAIVATVDLEKKIKNTAWQKFLTTGPVALLPRADNLYALIWSAEDSFANKLLAMSVKDFEINLSKATQYEFGKIKLASNRYSFNLVSKYTTKLYQKRCIFIGDAARFIHPLFGQGANMGGLDVLAIKEMLQHNEQNLGYAFHKIRYKDGVLLGEVAESLNSSACLQSDLIAYLRASLGLVAIKNNCIKRSLIAYAGGKRINQTTPYSFNWPSY
jgi:ubiquinone biosynthesis UbiH/UbiF/VisC/COQ6 family hydroxylase